MSVHYCSFNNLVCLYVVVAVVGIYEGINSMLGITLCLRVSTYLLIYSLMIKGRDT
jgi:hypothetical protein